jgi:hypothetical protein
MSLIELCFLYNTTGDVSPENHWESPVTGVRTLCWHTTPFYTNKSVYCLIHFLVGCSLLFLSPYITVAVIHVTSGHTPNRSRPFGSTADRFIYCWFHFRFSSPVCPPAWSPQVVPVWIPLSPISRWMTLTAPHRGLVTIVILLQEYIGPPCSAH